MPRARRLKLEEIEEARERLRAHLPPTPLRRSFALRQREAWLKLECWQPTGSFKVRGALNHLLSIPEDQLQRGVVAASAGNHALGLAWAAEVLGGHVPVTLFLPESAPRAKVAKLRTFPVILWQEGATYEDSEEIARRHAETEGARYVHAFEDPLTAAGQGTVGLEILEQLPDVKRIVVPVGGGGLIAAVAVAAKAKRPEVEIVAVQPEASPSLRESLAQDKPLLRYPAGPTLADGVAGGIGEIAFLHRELLDDVVVVPERALEEAIVALLSEDQVVAEGAGALGVAALRSGALAANGPTALVVTGGNIDAEQLARLMRGTRGWHNGGNAPPPR